MHPILSSLLSRLLVDRRNGHRRAVIARYHDLVRISRCSAAQQRAHQTACLIDLLEHARAHVPFWRDAIPATLSPEDALDVLAALPVMNRGLIQQDPSRFCAEDADEWFDDTTGGSTGTPLRFRVDRSTQIAREASLYWSNHLAGWRYGERIAMLWGSDRDVGNAKKDPKLEMRWFIDNMRWYNAFDMGEERMEAFHADMSRRRPHLVVAYAGSLLIYARFLEEKGWKPAYPLKALVSSAEMLTENMRASIERVFEVPVFNRYGNREAGAIGAEDADGDGFLVNAHDFLVEIDSPDPLHEPGNILLTYFPNRAMPFIRYDTGDLGVWATQPDGQADTRRIARIVGRRGDTIRTAGGKLIHGEYFTHLLYGHDNVKQFQFVQESPSEYRLLVVLGGPVDETQEARWKEQILGHVGHDARLNVEYVGEIPLLPSGKHKFTISRVTGNEE